MPHKNLIHDYQNEVTAHLDVNSKDTRLYEWWYYLENIQPGKNEIIVRLNAHSHETLAHNGKMIQDIEIVEVLTLAK